MPDGLAVNSERDTGKTLSCMFQIHHHSTYTIPGLIKSMFAWREVAHS